MIVRRDGGNESIPIPPVIPNLEASQYLYGRSISLFIYGSESIWETIKIPFEITILSRLRGHGRDSAVFRPPQPLFTVEALDWTAKPANAIIEATLFIIWLHHFSPPPRIPRCSGRSSCRPRTRFSTENRRREERQVGRRRAQKCFNC